MAGYSLPQGRGIMANWRPGVHRLSKLPILLLLLFSCSQSLAGDISLAWDASVSAGVAGYKVYVGSGSVTYGTPIAIGDQTAYKVTGLAAGTYYFAVTAYDAGGNESGFSNEVSKTITGSVANVCDVNGDGTVDAPDLQRLANIYLGTGQYSAGFDLNNDGKIDVGDMSILNNVLFGTRRCP
jgi:hypothetical protein